MSVHTRQQDQQRSAHMDFNKIVIAVRKQLFEGLELLLDGMFDGADDTLFALAEKADSNQLQQIYFETMRMLRLERTNIKHVFAAELDETFQPGTKKFDTNTNQDFDEDELTLVDQDSMEEMVAITGMHTKAMQMFKEELLHLGKRLEFIAENTPTVFRQKAIEPKNICEVFRDAIAPVGEQMEIQNKLILYKLFDNKLVCNLGDLYKAINHNLISAGVMPKITVGQLVGRQPGRSGGTQLNTHPGDIETEYSAPVIDSRLQAFDESNYSRFQSTNPEALDYQSVQVLSQFLQDAVPAGSSNAASPVNYLSTNEVLRGLSGLQSNSAEQHTASAAGLKMALQKEAGKHRGDATNLQVSQLDEKTIDLIQLLFDAMLADDSVSELMKSLLMRLQIPVVKSAMLDTEFFTNPFHPSRNLLNRLATSGVRIGSEEDPLFPKMESVVDSLVENFDQDVVAFQVALDQLNAIIHEDEVQARKAEEKTQKQVLRQHARDIVLRELKVQIRGRNFPQGAHGLVLKHWSTVMYHKYIKYGKDSEQWFASVDMLKELIASLQSHDDRFSSSALEAKYTNLCEQVEIELLNSRQDREEILDALDSIKLIHTFYIDNRRHEEKIQNSDKTEATDPSTVLSIGEDKKGNSEIVVDKVVDDNYHDSDIDVVPVFPQETPEFDLSSETAEDIATAMALGLTELLPELEAIGVDPAKFQKIPVEKHTEQEDSNSDLSQEVADKESEITFEIESKDIQEEEEPITAPEMNTEPLQQEITSHDIAEHKDAELIFDTTVDDSFSIPVLNSDSKEETDPLPLPSSQHAEETVTTRQNKELASDESVNSHSEISTEKDTSATALPNILKRLPEGIKPGSWINLYTGYREPEIRAKLSVVIPENQTLVFVDREGFKAAEKHVDELLEELEEGLSTVVVEHSVFDKALSSVISNLSAY